MSIQANINQGISLMSLLYSQTPAAEQARTRKMVEAEAPRRAAQLELAQKEADIKVAEAEKKKQMNIALEREAAKEEKQANIATLSATHSEHARLVGELARGKKGELTSTEKTRTDFEEHIKTRQAAIKSGKALFDASPSDELAHNLGTWEREIGEIETAKSAYEKKQKEIAKEEKSQKAEAKRKQREEAEASARVAAEEENRRLAFSRQIMEGVYSTDPAFDPRRMNYGKK